MKIYLKIILIINKIDALYENTRSRDRTYRTVQGSL